MVTMGYHIPPPISAQFLNDFRVTTSWQEMVHTVPSPTKEMSPSGQENGIEKGMVSTEIEHPSITLATTSWYSDSP